MLKRVVITNYLGESMEYKIDGVQVDNPSGLIITSIDGLGPVKANINMTEITTTDGGLYNSARLSARNIVIKALFTHAASIEEARLLSYKYFPIKKKVTVRIETDNRIAETEGYVESNEPDIFAEKSGCQISILCESPFFKDMSPLGNKVTEFSNIEPLFEFILDVDTSFEFGNIENQRECTVTYDGDSDTGFYLYINIKQDTSTIRIMNSITGEQMLLNGDRLNINNVTGFKTGDLVTICTIQGKKSMYLTRSAVRKNILNILDKDSNWFKLTHGDNIFSYLVTPAESSLYVEFAIEAQNLFEGV